MVGRLSRWEELEKIAQPHQCEFRYWDGIRCDVQDLPFGTPNCPKHSGRPR